MRKLLIAFSLALLFFSCNDDDVSNNNNNDNEIKGDPTFTVTYQLDPPVAKPPNFVVTHEAIGALPVDNNKYKLGDTVTVLSANIKSKEIATGKITHEFDCWLGFGLKINNHGYWMPGDEFVIENNVIFSVIVKPYFED